MFYILQYKISLTLRLVGRKEGLLLNTLLTRLQVAQSKIMLKGLHKNHQELVSIVVHWLNSSGILIQHKCITYWDKTHSFRLVLKLGMEWKTFMSFGRSLHILVAA